MKHPYVQLINRDPIWMFRITGYMKITLKQILSFMWCTGDFAVRFSDYSNFSFSTSERPATVGNYLLGTSTSFLLIFQDPKAQEGFIGEERDELCSLMINFPNKSNTWKNLENLVYLISFDLCFRDSAFQFSVLHSRQ